jgi:hypothetical protein
LRGGWVRVQHHEDVGFVKPEPFHQCRAHALHVVGTSVQLTFGAQIIASYQKRPLGQCVFFCFFFVSRCVCVCDLSSETATIHLSSVSLSTQRMTLPLCVYVCARAIPISKQNT